MTQENSWFLALVVESVVAIGTVGALLAALATLRYERIERRRSEVRGVRAWVRWGSPNADEGDDILKGSRWGAETVPEMCIENASEEFIYDIHMALWPTRSGRVHFSARHDQLAPGANEVSRFPMNTETLFKFQKLEGGRLGVETLFRDSRGQRWRRARDGQLTRVKPVRWYAPWRTVHQFDSAEVPWWAMRTRWRDRWRDHADIDPLPPSWWAVDLRWQRWRYARKYDAVKIRPWKLVTRWRSRAEIAERRRRQGLPIPMWAFDEWWRYRRYVASWRRAERRKQREQRKWERADAG